MSDASRQPSPLQQRDPDLAEPKGGINRNIRDSNVAISGRPGLLLHHQSFKAAAALTNHSQVTEVLQHRAVCEYAICLEASLDDSDAPRPHTDH